METLKKEEIQEETQNEEPTTNLNTLPDIIGNKPKNIGREEEQPNTGGEITQSQPTGEEQPKTTGKETQNINLEQSNINQSKEQLSIDESEKLKENVASIKSIVDSFSIKSTSPQYLPPSTGESNTNLLTYQSTAIENIKENINNSIKSIDPILNLTTQSIENNETKEEVLKNIDTILKNYTTSYQKMISVRKTLMDLYNISPDLTVTSVDLLSKANSSAHQIGLLVSLLERSKEIIETGTQGTKYAFDTTSHLKHENKQSADLATKGHNIDNQFRLITEESLSRDDKKREITNLMTNIKGYIEIAKNIIPTEVTNSDKVHNEIKEVIKGSIPNTQPLIDNKKIDKRYNKVFVYANDTIKGLVGINQKLAGGLTLLNNNDLETNETYAKDLNTIKETFNVINDTNQELNDIEQSNDAIKRKIEKVGYNSFVEVVESEKKIFKSNQTKLSEIEKNYNDRITIVNNIRLKFFTKEQKDEIDRASNNISTDSTESKFETVQRKTLDLADDFDTFEFLSDFINQVNQLSPKVVAYINFLEDKVKFIHNLSPAPNLTKEAVNQIVEKFKTAEKEIETYKTDNDMISDLTTDINRFKDLQNSTSTLSQDFQTNFQELGQSLTKYLSTIQDFERELQEEKSLFQKQSAEYMRTGQTFDQNKPSNITAVTPKESKESIETSTGVIKFQPVYEGDKLKGYKPAYSTFTESVTKPSEVQPKTGTVDQIEQEIKNFQKTIDSIADRNIEGNDEIDQPLIKIMELSSEGAKQLQFKAFFKPQRGLVLDKIEINRYFTNKQ